MWRRRRSEAHFGGIEAGGPGVGHDGKKLVEIRAVRGAGGQFAPVEAGAVGLEEPAADLVTVRSPEPHGAGLVQPAAGSAVPGADAPESRERRTGRSDMNPGGLPTSAAAEEQFHTTGTERRHDHDDGSGQRAVAAAAFRNLPLHVQLRSLVGDRLLLPQQGFQLGSDQRVGKGNVSQAGFARRASASRAAVVCRSRTRSSAR